MEGVELGLPSNNTSKTKIQIKISNEASELDNNYKKYKFQYTIIIQNSWINL